MHVRHRIVRALEVSHRLNRPNSNCSSVRNRYCHRDLLKFENEKIIAAVVMLISYEVISGKLLAFDRLIAISKSSRGNSKLIFHIIEFMLK